MYLVYHDLEYVLLGLLFSKWPLKKMINIFIKGVKSCILPTGSVKIISPNPELILDTNRTQTVLNS